MFDRTRPTDGHPHQSNAESFERSRQMKSFEDSGKVVCSEPSLTSGKNHFHEMNGDVGMGKV